MLSPLEFKRLRLELIKVSAAKADLEFRVEELLDQVEKVRSNIEAQTLHEENLRKRIAEQEAQAPVLKT